MGIFAEKNCKCGLFFPMRAGYAKPEINLPWPKLNFPGTFLYKSLGIQVSIQDIGPECKFAPQDKTLTWWHKICGILNPQGADNKKQTFMPQEEIQKLPVIP